MTWRSLGILWSILGASFLPAHSAPSQNDSATCIQCHDAEIGNPSSMASASAIASKSALLLNRRVLEYMEGTYREQIRLDGERAVYTVSDDDHVFRADLAWVLGSATMGQAFLYRDRHGNWRETQVTYYSALGNLGRMLGGRAPTDFDSATGEQLSEGLVRSCFKCHATGLKPDEPLETSKLLPGIRCIQCHSGAEAHMDAVRNGRMVVPEEQLSDLSSEGVSELCGKCHRTWSNIILNGPRGRDNVRFQPYRLANSKCFDPVDRRISCVACHDPHHPVETSWRFYDSKCLGCHSADSKPVGSTQARVCKVGNEHCAACHMPKYTLTDTKEAFTDHWIRIVKPNEGYPD
jgi:Cytochrome c554 and c-prime